MKKRFFDMTEDEIKKKVRLTPDEKTAVDNLLAAAKALPKSICIEVDDDWDGEGHLQVMSPSGEPPQEVAQFLMNAKVSDRPS